MNPPGGGDDDQGREYIVLRGPANMSLDTYAIVAIENEHGSGGTNDIGTVDMIIPLDGYETDSNGLLTIRDLDDSDMLGDFDPADASSSEFAFQWQDDTGSYGGNTLENEGTNLFLVRNIDGSLEQEIDGVTKGTLLDIDHDGQLDYTEVSPPTGWIQPWDDQVIDCIFIPLKSKPLGTNPSTQQVDYTATGVTSYTHISCERQTGSTADWFARLDDSTALVADILTTGSDDYTIDDSEVYFSNDSSLGAVAQDMVALASIEIELGNSLYFTVKDSTVSHNVWTH